MNITKKKKKYTSQFHQSRASRLPLCVVSSACCRHAWLWGNISSQTEIQSEPQGESHPKATIVNVHPQCRDKVLVFFKKQMIQVCHDQLCCLLTLWPPWRCVFLFPLWPMSRCCVEQSAEDFFFLLLDFWHIHWEHYKHKCEKMELFWLLPPVTFMQPF